MFLVFSNFDFQFLTMTSRGGQYFYRFSSACRLIEYNSSIIYFCLRSNFRERTTLKEKKMEKTGNLILTARECALSLLPWR